MLNVKRSKYSTIPDAMTPKNVPHTIAVSLSFSAMFEKGGKLLGSKIGTGFIISDSETESVIVTNRHILEKVFGGKRIGQHTYLCLRERAKEVEK